MIAPAALALMLTIALDPPQAGPAGAASDLLYEEYTAAYQAWFDETRRPTPPAGAELPPRPDGAAYARRFLAIARDHPSEPVAATALVRAIAVDPFGAAWGETFDRLNRDHAGSPAIGPCLATVAFDVTRPEVEGFLRRVIRENPSAQVRAGATEALAHHLLRIEDEGKHFRARPDRAREVAAKLGEAEVGRFRDRDGAALRREAEQLLDTLIRDHAGTPSFDRRGLSYGERAGARLRELVVGRPAPEIAGTDDAGHPLRLSDHRGKVVVLIWWASWCGPCLAMIPPERELAERYRNRSFVLLGINGDEDPARMREQIRNHGITWPSWVDGGPEGPISTYWDVKGWPTVYVLDARGVILYKGGRDEEAMDWAIEAALAGDSPLPQDRD